MVATYTDTEQRAPDGVHCVHCGADSTAALNESRAAYEAWWAEHSHVGHALREAAQSAPAPLARALIALAEHLGG
ncbi:MAG: hypothetical protein KGK07_13510 [Chloroflexota bacterium]|nr:hypothetical protein [Chloroflexota bacterium]